MKRILKTLSNKGTLIFFLVVLFLFLPTAFNKEAQTDVRAIMTAIGIDKKQNEYEVSCLMVIPTTGQDPNSGLQLVTAKGPSVSKAVNQLSQDLGKEIGFAHCDIIIMNDEAIEDNITKTLDYFIRGYNITKKAYVVNCPDGAKEMLKTTLKEKSLPTLLLANLVNREDNAVMGVGSDVDLIYRNYFEKSGVNYLNVFELLKDDSESGESGGTGQESSGQDSGSSQSQQQKKITSNNKLVFLKNGVKSCEIDEDEGTLYSIYKGQIDRGYLYLEDVSEDEKSHAKVGVDLVKIKRKNKYIFEDGRPTIKCHITLVVALHEISDEELDEEQVDNTRTHIGKGIKEAIREKFNVSANKIIEKSIENNTDIFEFYNKFYKHDNKKWKEYMASLENQEDYLKDCQIKLDITIKDKF